jgi:hypothetical protein
MKPLPTTFRSDGFDFQLLLREGDVALLRKTKPASHSRLTRLLSFIEPRSTSALAVTSYWRASACQMMSTGEHGVGHTLIASWQTESSIN